MIGSILPRVRLIIGSILPAAVAAAAAGVWAVSVVVMSVVMSVPTMSQNATGVIFKNYFTHGVMYFKSSKTGVIFKKILIFGEYE